MNKGFKVGDVVEALVTMNFCNGTCHEKGERYVIKDGEEEYYNLFKINYKFVPIYDKFTYW